MDNEIMSTETINKPVNFHMKYWLVENKMFLGNNSEDMFLNLFSLYSAVGLINN